MVTGQLQTQYECKERGKTRRVRLYFISSFQREGIIYVTTLTLHLRFHPPENQTHHISIQYVKQL